MPAHISNSKIDLKAIIVSAATLLAISALASPSKLFAAGSEATVTTVSLPDPTVPAGKIAVIQAAVTAGGAPVTIGYVTFLEGNVVLGSAPLGSDGTATFSTPWPLKQQNSLDTVGPATLSQ
jgi:hypothetical protein